MSHIKPLSETAESVTLSRADFDAMLEELEDAEDRMAVLEDCLLDFKPEENLTCCRWRTRCALSTGSVQSRFGARNVA